MSIPQGDLRLLTTDIAKRLLDSTIPGRLGYIALDGTPRVVPTWHVWTGEELVMATFVRCPPLGISRPARRLAALEAHPAVAVTIDTAAEPPDVLMLRGRVSVARVDGMVPEQAEAARRFLGETGGREYVEHADHPETIMARIAIIPDWVGVLDFRTRAPSIIGG
jgi:hypothetical protein